MQLKIILDYISSIADNSFTDHHDIRALMGQILKIMNIGK